MNNRPSVAPILSVLVGSFLLSLPLSAAEPLPAGNPATPPTVKPLASPPASAPGDSPASTTPAAPQSEAPLTYTVKSGDSLWDVAHKFHTTVTKLKKANNLKKTHIKPGQVLQIPGGKTASSPTGKPAKNASLPEKKSKEIAFHSTHRAEPVQDFDLPASTFASCPVPAASATDVDEPALTPPPVPVANNIPAKEEPSPELADTDAPVTPAVSKAPVRSTLPPPLSPRPAPTAMTTLKTPSYSYSATTPAPQPVHRGLFSFFYTPPPAADWGSRFTQVARDLGNRDIDYDDAWCPPGEAHSWAMDCSNTTRYLYKVTTGIQLPRTASDQYYYLHLQNKAWDVPQTSTGFADCNYLRQNLKPGDLLFWENTYKPERQPPITHVMVYLGTNARGQWTMAGSQTGRGGEHNRRHGGPDIYVFDPTKPCGGYTTWMGLVHHQGRFCAYGRPLEADKAKLAVAAND